MLPTCPQADEKRQQAAAAQKGFGVLESADLSHRARAYVALDIEPLRNVVLPADAANSGVRRTGWYIDPAFALALHGCQSRDRGLWIARSVLKLPDDLDHHVPSLGDHLIVIRLDAGALRGRRHGVEGI